ncbi:MAG: hypothetical protein AB8D52_12870 [Gammaproteobacteria bacterium]
MGLKQPRAIAPLTLNELEKLPTHRIMAYLQKLHACENSLEESDLELHEIARKGIVFKNTKEWQKQYEIVKSELQTRPNIERNTKD